MEGLDAADINAEDGQDYMGMGPLIKKLEKEKLKDFSVDNLNMFEEPTDSESKDDKKFSPDAIKKHVELFEKKFKRHEEFLKNFTDAGIALWRDTTAYGYSSPLTSLKELVFGP